MGGADGSLALLGFGHLVSITVVSGDQNGTTGYFYVDGDEEMGFAGYPVECKGYTNGSLAVNDMINGNINYVIIDSAPAACIADAYNKMN